MTMSATLTRRLRRAAAAAVCAATVALPFSLAGAPAAQAAQAPRAPQIAGFTSLKLLNGWTNSPYHTAHPAVRLSSGIVQFKGAMSTSGTSDEAFVLPAADRPATDVYVNVDLCASAEGRLLIEPSGGVFVEDEDAWSDAQCFTSLDGVSFARSASGFTSLKLEHGWKNSPYSTSKAAVRVINGIVHFKGAIWTGGTNAIPFTLPKAFRPASDVYVNVDLCNAHNGRLYVQTTGEVTVNTETTWAQAKCFTSLDGATFARSGSGFTSIKLINNWHGKPYDTAPVGARVINGFVQLRGAMETSGTKTTPFTLPKAFRPASTVWVPVDLCDAHYGRLWITPSGTVNVQVNDETSTWSDAQCFTSVEGVSFAR
jgi:hypothetical protein